MPTSENLLWENHSQFLLPEDGMPPLAPPCELHSASASLFARQYWDSLYFFLLVHKLRRVTSSLLGAILSFPHTMQRRQGQKYHPEPQYYLHASVADSREPGELPPDLPAFQRSHTDGTATTDDSTDGSTAAVDFPSLSSLSSLPSLPSFTSIAPFWRRSSGLSPIQPRTSTCAFVPALAARKGRSSYDFPSSRAFSLAKPCPASRRGATRSVVSTGRSNIPQFSIPQSTAKVPISMQIIRRSLTGTGLQRADEGAVVRRTYKNSCCRVLVYVHHVKEHTGTAQCNLVLL